MPSTKYVVLRSAPDGTQSPAGGSSVWRVEKMVDAANHKAAVAAVVKNMANGQTEGTFIAVPMRSWKQVKVHVETTPRVKFT